MPWYIKRITPSKDVLLILSINKTQKQLFFALLRVSCSDWYSGEQCWRTADMNLVQILIRREGILSEQKTEQNQVSGRENKYQVSINLQNKKF